MGKQRGNYRPEKQPALVLLTPGFADGVGDTTCIPVLQLFVKNLKRQFPDLEIIVLAFQYPFKAGYYAFHGAQVISFNGRNRRRLFRLLVWMKVWLTMGRLQRRFQILGLLSFWLGECAFLGSLFARRWHLKHFTWLLGQDARAGNPFFSLIRPRAEHLVVLSDAMAREVARHYGLKPRHIIPFGVDVSMFPVSLQRRTIDILGAGSLIPLKRYDLFVEVVEGLRQVFPDLKVVLCGKGPEKDRLWDAIVSKGLQENISLMEEVPHAQVLGLMQQSRIFLHTSAYEGFAAVCAEALYAGAHVVSFCQSVARPINHWHIVGTPEEMIDRLVLLLKDPELSHESVLPFTLQEACIAVMALFGDQAGDQGR